MNYNYEPEVDDGEGRRVEQCGGKRLEGGVDGLGLATRVHVVEQCCTHLVELAWGPEVQVHTEAHTCMHTCQTHVHLHSNKHSYIGYNGMQHAYT
jgi:hypothetical protein